MKKDKEQLIKDFKKSNKERREKIAKAAGYSTSAEYLASLETKIKVKKTTKKATKTAKKEMLDYVVAFDTTGSMMSYIDDVKKHVEKLIPEMFSQDIDLRMKIVAFGDYCDMPSKDVFGYAYQEIDLTDNISELTNFVKGAKNTSGGDSEEFYELVIKKIVEETPWREGSKKAVLFIADYDPHRVGYSYNQIVKNAQIDWKKEAQKAAEKGIAFDTLAVLGDTFPWYKELSAITKGVWLPFQSSGKTSHIFAASAYARGGEKSRATFMSMSATASMSGDAELIGTYKSLSTLMDTPATATSSTGTFTSSTSTGTRKTKLK
jgi:hypothetical protein